MLILPRNIQALACCAGACLQSSFCTWGNFNRRKWGFFNRRKLGNIQPALTLKNPSIERLKALLAFFRGVAVAAHMQAGRKLRKELFELFGEGALPFTLVALAQLAKRPRCLTPRPPAYQAKDISDVELRLAWQLWRIAQTVHQELSDAFMQHGIARVCPQCGRLFVVLKRSYCSEHCRKAYHDEKLYRRKKSESRPAYTV